MVNIDTVYQRVLTLANKEQRGYITPQEFNLFANQAQMEIFEQYFYDLSQGRRLQGNQTVFSDIEDMLEEKMQIFEVSHGPNAINSYVAAGGGGINKRVPTEFYRIHRIELNNITCELLNTKDFNEVRQSPLTKPTINRPIANVRGGIIRVLSGPQTPVTPTGIIFFRRPVQVRWGYIVINDKALYNGNASTDFELHMAEETELVYKILKYAGIAMKRDDVMRAGQGMEITQIQQEKA